MVPPRNDCGVRIVLYRHLVERAPFELHVASQADFADDLLIHTKLELPWPVQRLRKSRFGPMFRRWIQDFENLVWPVLGSRALERAVDVFKPDVILTLAETGICHLAAKIAKRRGIPLAGLFLDWFPIMEPHFGHKLTQRILSRRYRRLYKQCDLAICTSEGMKEVLGKHPNSHVIYPMPGKHTIPRKNYAPKNLKFRLVYVGASQGLYGRVLRSLLKKVKTSSIEFIIVGNTGDWEKKEKFEAIKNGNLLGFMPPKEAAKILASADALLVVMSFEKNLKLFMKTSFTTKFLDYAAFEKPIVVWGPHFCSPCRFAERENSALVVKTKSPLKLISSVIKLSKNTEELKRLTEASKKLKKEKFNPENLQKIFVSEICKLQNRKKIVRQN